MRTRYGKYVVEVNWDYGSTSTATQASNTEVFQFQFNLYLPSSLHVLDQFYTCHSRVLTLRRDEIPRLCRCSRCSIVELVKLSTNWNWSEWSDSDKLKHKHAFEMRIKEFLKSTRRVNLTKAIDGIVTKILYELFDIPKDWSCRIPEGFFINVDIYHERAPFLLGNIVPIDELLASAESNSLMLVKEAIMRLETLCSICLEDFDKDVITTRLPCSHICHGHCLALLQWQEIDRYRKCPLCLEPIPFSVAHFSATLCDSISTTTYYSKVERKVCAPSSRSLSWGMFLLVSPAKKRVCIHEGSKDLQIQFNLYKSNGFGCAGHYSEVERFDGVRKTQLGSESQLLTIPNRHREQLQPNMITQVLKSMGVPLYEQPPIVGKIFEVIANNNFDDPYAFINVDLYEETLSLVDEETLSLVDLSTVMNASHNKLPPATNKVAIEKLGKVKLD